MVNNLPDWMTLTNLRTFRNGEEVRLWRCSVELSGVDDFFSRTGETQDGAVVATINALHDLRAEVASKIEQMAATLPKE